MVEHRLAKARAAGSNPVSRSFLLNSVVTPHGDIGLSPSGKAQGFDPCIRRFESCQPCFLVSLISLII